MRQIQRSCLFIKCTEYSHQQNIVLARSADANSNTITVKIALWKWNENDKNELNLVISNLNFVHIIMLSGHWYFAEISIFVSIPEIYIFYLLYLFCHSHIEYFESSVAVDEVRGRYDTLLCCCCYTHCLYKYLFYPRTLYYDSLLNSIVKRNKWKMYIVT